MRRISRSILPVGLLLLVSSPAWAQGRGGFGLGGGPAALLGNESVQQELKLDSSQAEKARQIADDLREKMREQFGSLRDLAPEERREKMAELNRKMNEETRAALKDVFKPEQIKRLEQISLQQQGVNAFASPQVADKLKLTEDQKTKIRDLIQDSGEQMRSIFQDAQGGDRAAAMEKLRTLRRETHDKALALLTADQKKSWEEMIGKPFEVVFQPRNQ